MNILHALWVVPETDRQLPWGQALLAQIAIQLCFVLLAFFGYLAFAWPMRRSPARLELSPGAFVAPAASFYPATQAIVLMWFAGGLVALAIKFSAPSSLVLPLAPAGWLLSLRRPFVALSSTGITVQRHVRRTHSPWSELAHEGPAAPPKALAPHEVVPERRARMGQFAVSEDLPVGWLHADQAFLAFAIRHYIVGVERRDFVGAPAEHEELQRIWHSRPLATLER